LVISLSRTPNRRLPPPERASPGDDLDRTRPRPPREQRTADRHVHGFIVLAIGIALLALAADPGSLIGEGRPTLGGIAIVIGLVVLAMFAMAGLYTLQPNERRSCSSSRLRGTSRVPARATKPVLHRRRCRCRRNLNGDG